MRNGSPSAPRSSSGSPRRARSLAEDDGRAVPRLVPIRIGSELTVGRIPTVVARERKPEAPQEHAGGNSLVADYPNRPPATVYSAAFRAATELGFAITRRNDAALALTFRTAGPTTSWPVVEMTAAVHSHADAARVVVAGKNTGYRLLMADWHQTKTIGLLFLDRLTSVLSRVPGPEPDVQPGASTVEQLKSIADLRDRGFLTEDEFAAAKKHLLS
jgi:Short C-terminal domain